jgi:hypothetical protein
MEDRILKNIIARESKPARSISHRVIFVRPLAVCLILLVFATGAAFAANIGGIRDNIFGSGNPGIVSAIENDYIQNVDMEYIVSNGIGVKIDSVVMDDSTFAIVYNIRLDKAVSSNVNYINLEDVVICDENGVVITGEGKGMIATGGNINVISGDGENVKLKVIEYNDLHSFPKSEKIYISFTTANFFAEEKMVRQIKGEWSFEIDMSEKFVSREKIPYTAVASEEFEVLSAELTITSFDVSLKFKTEPHTITKSLTLTDGNGNEYQASGIAVWDEGFSIGTSFPVTIFNATDSLTLFYDDVSVDLTRN